MQTKISAAVCERCIPVEEVVVVDCHKRGTFACERGHVGLGQWSDWQCFLDDGLHTA